MTASPAPHNGSEAQGNGTITAAEDLSVYLLNQVRQNVTFYRKKMVIDDWLFNTGFVSITFSWTV